MTEAKPPQQTPDWLHLWQSGVSRWLPSTAAATDVVCAAGRATELCARPSTLSRIVSGTGRFFVGDQPAGDGAVGHDGVARASYTPSRAGLFQVSFAQGRGGAASAQFAHNLQVVDYDTPVIAVDIGAARTNPHALRAGAIVLQEAGFAFFYIDLQARERLPALRELLDTLNAPPASILADAYEHQLQTLGVDFRGVFLDAAVRRLRANGVGVCGTFGTDPNAAAGPTLPGLALDPATPASISMAALQSFISESKASFQDWKNTVASAGSDAVLRLDMMTGTTSVPGNRCNVEFDNRKARDAIFDAIENAKSHVFVQFYIFEEGYFTEELAVRLVRKARQGVRVRLLVDAMYSLAGMLGATNPIAEGLREEPNIEVLANAPIDRVEKVDTRSMKERDHRKLIVVDDALAFVSGRNAGDPYYYGFDEVPIADFTAHERIPWVDAHVELYGPIVSEVCETFERAWSQNGGAEFPRETSAKAPAMAGDDRCRLVVHHGIGDVNALAAYEAMIGAAQSRIYVVNAYPVFGRLGEAMERALRRGVRVMLLTGNAKARRADGSFFRGGLHRELFDYMLKQSLEGLVRAGVDLYEYTTTPLPNVVARQGVIRPYVHAKVMVVDGAIASIGSANLDATASYWEREANIVIEGGEVPKSLEATLEEFCERGYKVDLESEYWRREKAQREVSSRLWPTRFYS